MNKNYFKILRAGINTTFQDHGRENLYHIGIPFSGAMDNRNYLLANKLVGNKTELSCNRICLSRTFIRNIQEKK